MERQPLKGFIYAFSCTLLWAALPIALKQVMDFMPPLSILWFRFATAALALGIYLYFQDGLPRKRSLRWMNLRLIIPATLCLAINFYFYNLSLKYISPAVSQVSGQILPFLMIAAGWFVFKEPFSKYQKIGAVILACGLLLFFNTRLISFFDGENPALVKGLLLSVSASAVWVIYAIAQKLLMHRFYPQQVLFMIYFGCFLCFSPSVEFHSILTLDIFALFCLIFCCLNTVLAYGAYAQAVKYWNLSKISATTATGPIFTILFSDIAHLITPNRFASAPLNTIAYFGVIVVIAGAVFSTLGHEKVRTRPPRFKNS